MSVKDEMFGFAELIECPTADSEKVQLGATRLIQAVCSRESAGVRPGQPLKNELIDDLRKIRRSQHYFGTDYSPVRMGPLRLSTAC